MSLKDRLNLIDKIDGYIEDKKRAGEILPHKSVGMKCSAIANYLFYGTSFSEYFAYRFLRIESCGKVVFHDAQAHVSVF